MSRQDLFRRPLPQRVAMIGSATMAMVAVMVAVARAPPVREDPRSAAVEMLVPSAMPIAAEADVFRTSPGMFAIDPKAVGRRAAHPRTLATFRTLRPYPGAPPRIPHGLTAEELRTTGCKTCHERGGYSQRFRTYVPVTPHPELEACLQCHATDASVVGISLPGRDPDAVCRQCHAPGRPPAAVRQLDWRTAAWPRVTPSTSTGAPPPIPHGLQLRGRCLVCHAGPAAVAEIRTTHPERTNCRQCHVSADGDVRPFTRAVAGVAYRAGGVP